MKHGTKLVFSYFVALVFLATEISSFPVSPAENVESHKTPQGKQGILEIPKQAATVVRHWIDLSLQNIFNISAPSQSLLPPQLQNSVVGNLLLGNLYATLAPPIDYTPQRPAQQTQVKPIAVTNEESYASHSQKVESEPTTTKPKPATKPKSTTTPSPPKQVETKVASTSPPSPPKEIEPLDLSPPIPPPPNTEPEEVTSTKKPRTRPHRTRGPERVHVLETDTSLTGIYNSYGLLVNNNPDDEVYWIPDATRASVIIPIQPTTAPSTTTEATEPTTEPSPVETTTEEEEEEGGEEIFKTKKAALS